MSARVFNPLVLSEMRRMIGRSNSDASPAAVASVRRDLFGPIDHEEAQSFVDRELAAMRRRQNEKWGFDFDKEKPLDNSNFHWERINPEDYTLRLASIVGQRKSEESIKDASTNTMSAIQDQSTQKLKTTVKQAHITDFMKCRKRSLSVDDISRQKADHLRKVDFSTVKVGTTDSLSKPTKSKRSRTRQHQ